MITFAHPGSPEMNRADKGQTWPRKMLRGSFTVLLRQEVVRSVVEVKMERSGWVRRYLGAKIDSI